MKFLFTSVMALAMSASARAQVSIGVEVGANVSGYNITTLNVSQSSSLKLTGMGGAVIEEQLSNHLYLQQGLLYVPNGYKTDLPGYTDGSVVYVIHALEVPVMLNYKLYMPADDHDRWTIGAGPYVAYNWDGIQRTRQGSTVDSRNDIRFGSGATDQMRRWDVGARIQGGYQLAEGFYARVHAQMGFLNLAPMPAIGNSIRNYNFGLSIGYLLSRNRNCARPVREHKVKASKTAATPPPPPTPEVRANGTLTAPQYQKKSMTYDK